MLSKRKMSKRRLVIFVVIHLIPVLLLVHNFNLKTFKVDISTIHKSVQSFFSNVMSLVAYAASSDEDSDHENLEQSNPEPAKQNHSIWKGQQNGQQTSKSLNLPQPKHSISSEVVVKVVSENFKLNLPAPKRSQTIFEDDDEFLHKKVDASLVEKPTNPKQGNVRKPVKITIPSLADLDSEEEEKSTKKCPSIGPNMPKSNSLLGILPPPKFNVSFGEPKEKPDSTPTGMTEPSTTKNISLVPHSVANKLKQIPTKFMKQSSLSVDHHNSDESENEEDEGVDFFSLNAEDKLPEVCASEINAMVAKKATQMSEFSKNLKHSEQNAAEVNEYADHSSSSSSSNVPEREQINFEALIGARAAKRAKKEDIQFIDISQDQVTSNQHKWTWNQLQNETQYQPTGRLVVGDPGTGTKKKHQITYLAYQAKANEAELQAMWANNRQSRRQTQSKYGF